MFFECRVVFNTMFGFSTTYWMALLSRFLLGFFNGLLGTIRVSVIYQSSEGSWDNGCMSVLLLNLLLCLRETRLFVIVNWSDICQKKGSLYKRKQSILKIQHDTGTKYWVTRTYDNHKKAELESPLSRRVVSEYNDSCW